MMCEIPATAGERGRKGKKRKRKRKKEERTVQVLVLAERTGEPAQENTGRAEQQPN
jgi:hypothetical protein